MSAEKNKRHPLLDDLAPDAELRGTTLRRNVKAVDAYHFVCGEVNRYEFCPHRAQAWRMMVQPYPESKDD